MIDTKNMTIGFIGTGNMATAMMTGFIKSKTINKNNIFTYDIDIKKLDSIKKKLSVNITTNYDEIIKTDIIIIAVKPNIVKSVLEKLSASSIPKDTFIIGIAGSLPLSLYESYIKSNTVIRIMPNTPIEVLEGFTSIVRGANTDEKCLTIVEHIFNKVGDSSIIDESMIDAYTAIAGCSPAYIYTLIDAMADAALLLGIPKIEAIKLISQTFLGSSKMVKESQVHPSILKDNVCTPKGITIEGIRKMEEGNVRSAMIETIIAGYNKSKELSK